MTTPSVERPRPLRKAARIFGGLTALVAGLASAGVITPGQGSAITGAVTAVAVLLGTFGIVVTAEQKVTPTSDPRDDLGRPLTAGE